MENIPSPALLLSLLPGLGPARFRDCVEQAGSARAALQTPPDQLPKLTAEARRRLAEFQARGEASALVSEGLRVQEMVEQHNAVIIDYEHNDYPELLRQIHRPPPVLYVKGDVSLLSLPQIAMVGTRHPTRSGLENTRAFAQYLAEGGFAITSGLALGIDGAAHHATLDAGGKTLAVMATGMDQIYPRRHRDLAAAIIDQGSLLVTEFPPTTAPQSTNFPRRNRIISGLSLGVLVMEAAIRSGSLITARYGLEQNREVFAVPGSIHNPQSRGCHALIREGAQLVETGEDIVRQLTGMIQHIACQQTAHQPASSRQMPSKAIKTNINAEPPVSPAKKSSVEQKPHQMTDEKEQQILQSLAYDTLTVEQMIERSGLTSAEVTTSLLTLEIKGLIKHSHWGYEVV